MASTAASSSTCWPLWPRTKDPVLDQAAAAALPGKMRPRPFGQRPPKGKGRGYALAVEDDEGEGDEVFLDEGDQDYDEEAFEGGEATDEGPMESLVQDMDFAEDQELAEAWPLRPSHLAPSVG